MPLYPLAWPQVPIAAIVGALLALMPAFIAPPPGMAVAPSAAPLDRRDAPRPVREEVPA